MDGFILCIKMQINEYLSKFNELSFEQKYSTVFDIVTQLKGKNENYAYIYETFVSRGETITEDALIIVYEEIIEYYFELKEEDAEYANAKLEQARQKLADIKEKEQKQHALDESAAEESLLEI